jgi:hypothetical protein
MCGLGHMMAKRIGGGPRRDADSHSTFSSTWFCYRQTADVIDQKA